MDESYGVTVSAIGMKGVAAVVVAEAIEEKD